MRRFLRLFERGYPVMVVLPARPRVVLLFTAATPALYIIVGVGFRPE